MSPGSEEPPSSSTLVVAVAAGGAVGALLRAAQADVLPGHGPAGPLASTLLVNVVGALALGALLGLTADERRGPALSRPLLGVGVYGSYTTFATFEAVALRAARTGDVALFLLGSLLLGLAAAAAGLRLGRRGPRVVALLVLVGPLLALVASAVAVGRAPSFGGSAHVALATALAVGGGGALGALARAGAALLGARASRTFPWGTLAVNVGGSFFVGLLPLEGVAEAFVITGCLGGLTTFSTFACETLRLHESGRAGQAAAYLLSNVLLGLGAAALGSALASG